MPDVFVERLKKFYNFNIKIEITQLASKYIDSQGNFAIPRLRNDFNEPGRNGRSEHTFEV